MKATDLAGRVTIESNEKPYSSGDGDYKGKLFALILMIVGLVSSVYVFRSINNASTDFLSQAAGQVVDLSMGVNAIDLTAGEGVNIPVVMHPDAGDVTLIDLKLNIDDVSVMEFIDVSMVASWAKMVKKEVSGNVVRIVIVADCYVDGCSTGIEAGQIAVVSLRAGLNVGSASITMDGTEIAVYNQMSNVLGSATGVVVNVGGGSGDDAEAPSVKITTPVEGDVLESSSRFIVSSAIYDNVGVNLVEFYVDGKKVCSMSVSPYVCEAKTKRSGDNVDIEVKAWDVSGNEASDSVRVELAK